MVKVVLWLILILFFLPGQISAYSQTQVIEMTPDGFEPASVTVDENATIIFVNNDSQPRWPASNVHPTHQLYPEFDPRRPLQPGESWPFKVEKPGTWKYHDHLFPHKRGTVIVTKENEESGTERDDRDSHSDIKQERGSKPSFLDTIKDTVSELLEAVKGFFTPKKQIQPPSGQDFVHLSPEKQTDVITGLAKDNPQKAWQYVKDVFKRKAGSSGNIHDLAHLAGNLLYKKKGFAGIGLCSSEFAFGCYHGFLDEAFAKSLDSLSDAQDACLQLSPKKSAFASAQKNQDFSGQVSGPVASCIHGIGHGVASYYATNDLKASLRTCRKLPTGSEYCFDGVFMEYVRSASSSFFHKEDPLYPCNDLEKEYGYAYSFACGRNQPSLLMSRFHMGYDEVVSICAASNSNPFKQACFDSLGFSLAATGEVEAIVVGCQKIGVAQFTKRCLKAAAGEMVFQEVPNWWEKAQSVCNADSELQRECLEYVERLIAEYGRKRDINFAPLENGEDVNSYIRKQLAICYEIGGRDGCYQQAAHVLYNQFGLAKTLALLKDNEAHTEVYARCHEVTHYLSRFEYEKQKNIGKVYAMCDSSCHGGCYHGTLEAYLKEQEAKKGYNLTEQFAKVCGKESNYQKPLEFYECLHGLGHAAMFVTDMELLQSLKLCDIFREQVHREKCYTGVFMENSSSSTSFDHKSIYIKADDPFYPCNIMDEKYLQICWQYQSSYFSIINNQDWAKVADMCLAIPQKYQDRCFRTIGTNQVGYTSSLQTMKEDCGLMPNSHFENICVAGVVVSLSYRFVGDVRKMVAFCSLVDLGFKEGCFRQIGASVIDWTTDASLRIRECQKIPDPKGASWCVRETQSI